MVTWNPGEILSARPTDSAPECGAPMTKTGWVTLRELTMRIWRVGIDRVIGAGLGRRGGRSSGPGGLRYGQGSFGCPPVPYSLRRARKLTSGPLLPRVVTRPAALGMAGVACCLMVTGCAQFDKALGQSTVEVYFTDNTTPAAMIKIMNACNHVNPNVKEEQNPAGTPPEDTAVIYNTTGASDAQIAELEECLSKYPQVQGINPE